MKKVFVITLCLLATSRLVVASFEGRESLNFNRGWKFQPGDASGENRIAFDDSKWSDVGLPHSFSLPYFAANDKFYVGYGWYRKHFDVPADWTGKRVNLEFDGVFQVAEVFVNGQRIGEHKGGYTGFTFDITDAVTPGDNVVAVRVNNLWNARLAPRAGEHAFSGGIYRDVRMVVTAPLHVAWYGTSVTTPQVSKASGTVNVKTEVVNNSVMAKSATMKTCVLDAKGNIVAQMESTQTIAAGATNVFDQTSQPIANPKLWSPETPNMYSVKTVVLDDGKPVDDCTSPLGFRWFKFTADQGFFSQRRALLFQGRERASGPRRLGRRGGRQRILSRCETGEGRRLRFYSRFALSARAGVCDGMRRAGNAVLVGKLFLGHGRLQRCRLVPQCVSD